jgi:hypothetical protein
VRIHYEWPKRRIDICRAGRQPERLLRGQDRAGAGVALNSMSLQSANVPVTVRDDAGNILATDTITLTATGHYAFMLVTDRYPNTANIRGTIEFDTPVFALGVFL